MDGQSLCAQASSLRPEDVQVFFEVGDDVVSFITRGTLHTGTIVRMNPKRAKVKCGDVAWSVPYPKLIAATRVDRGSSES